MKISEAQNVIKTLTDLFPNCFTAEQWQAHNRSSSAFITN